MLQTGPDGLVAFEHNIASDQQDISADLRETGGDLYDTTSNEISPADSRRSTPVPTVPSSTETEPPPDDRVKVSEDVTVEALASDHSSDNEFRTMKKPLFDDGTLVAPSNDSSDRPTKTPQGLNTSETKTSPGKLQQADESADENSHSGGLTGSAEANQFEPSQSDHHSTLNHSFAELSTPGHLIHSNSFPEVPQLNQVPAKQSTPPLSPPQINGISNGSGTGGELEDTNSPTDYFSGLQSNYLGSDFYASVHEPTFSSTPPDDEARFEEGVPLISAERSLKISLFDGLQSQEETSLDMKARNDASEEDLFPNLSVVRPDQDSSHPSRTLNRKSTDQVLESVHGTTRNHINPDISGKGNTTMLDNPIRDSIGVSTASIVLQPLNDEFNSGQPDSKPIPTEPTASSDTDLAAIWQAALADDEFLEDPISVESAAFFEDDGEGFLEETGETDTFETDLSSLPPQTVLNVAQQSIGSLHSINPAIGHTNYVGTPMQNSLPYPSRGLINHAGSHAVYGQYSASDNQGRPELSRKAQSFADKSKGGYTSPYDLPMEVIRPRKRATLQHANTINQDFSNSPPPPRSISIQAHALSPPLQSAYHPPTASPPLSNISNMSPPTTGLSLTPTNAIAPRPQPKARNESFFEELPVLKPRSTIGAARFVSPQSQSALPPLISQQRDGFQNASQVSPSSELSTNSSGPYQLLPPERMSLFNDTASTPAPAQAQPVTNARYSPISVSQHTAPPNRNRYAAHPAGPVRPPSASQILPFQPRTSSPLTRSSSAIQYRPADQATDPRLPVTEQFPTNARRPSLTSFQTERSQSVNAIGVKHDATHRSISYLHPLQQSQVLSPDNRFFDPPSNSQIRSYNPQIPPTKIPDNSRYTSQATGSLDNSKILSATNVHLPSISKPETHTERVPQPVTNFIVPSDGSEHDSLERWKGAPIMNFSFGGSIVTSFPKRIPRYGAGQTIPLIKCSPGEIVLRGGGKLPLDDYITAFPGPLKTKNKKKEVLDWLANGVQRLEQQRVQVLPDPAADLQKRQEEAIMLWKILHVLIEHDGALEGKPSAEQSVRVILSPEQNVSGALSQPSYGSNTPTNIVSRSSISQGMVAANDPETLNNVRKALLNGEREKAVWEAVDKRLWGHAMLISSTLPREIWKQVIQEFVRLEVRTAGDNTEPLAALYDIFAGNWEESMDELVPPSARAGLQMVSKTANTAPTKNALDGLDRWRETLSLILSNRSGDDSKALVALGQLLSRYGRIEAAHICYIFAKTPGLFGGPDDGQASVVLLGADHTRQPFSYNQNIDAILLTEVYEFAFAVLAPSAVLTIVPHLQAHKLYHAMILADHGYRDKAQQYCDAMMTALKSTTKLSPYYHAQLFGVIDDLGSRLRQAPKDGSSSWITKPSIDKVSGSVWNRFNQFIAGDDSDATSTGSGIAVESEAGPFARIGAGTPSVSRGPSPSDTYDAYGIGGGQPTAVAAVPLTNSRYAPPGYTPRSSLEQPVQSLPDSQKSAHLQPTNSENLQQEPAYLSSAPYTSDLYSNPRLIDDQQALRPAITAFPVEPEQNSPTPPTQHSSSAEAVYRGRYDPRQNLTSPAEPQLSQPNLHAKDSPAHPKRPDSIARPAMRIYAPRSNSHEPSMLTGNRLSASSMPRSASYAPRSASFEPRSASYQRSPLSDRPLPALPQPDTESFDPQKPDSYETLYPPDDCQPSSYEPYTASLKQPSSSYSYDPMIPPSNPPDSQSSHASSPTEAKSKKKSSLDDEDDDFEARAAALKKQEKVQKDREADEAFRRAAEADGNSFFHSAAKHLLINLFYLAHKGPNASNNSKWTLTGWFGSKAKDATAAPPSGPNKASGPIKARLGEENSFVYDANLKRWIDKKAGAENVPTATATPPPPKGPPSRAVSGSNAQDASASAITASSLTSPPAALARGLSPTSGPPSTNPSRNVSPSLGRTASPTASLPSAGTTALAPDSGLGPSSASSMPVLPSSRPSTGISDVSSIDDLIGAPQARKGGTIKKGKRGRSYVNVLEK